MKNPYHFLFLFILCDFGQWGVLAQRKSTTKATTTRTYKKLWQPKYPPWEDWVHAITRLHLTNLTGYLLKDMKVKLDHTKNFQEKYKKSMTYELGMLAAGIKTYFKHMLQLYKQYSDLNHFIEGKYNRYQVIDAFSVIQGDYNQIRFERDMFYTALERHEAIRRERAKKIQKYSSGNPNEAEILKQMDEGKTFDFRKGRRSNQPTEPGIVPNWDNLEIQINKKSSIPRPKPIQEVDSPLEQKNSKPKTKKLWKPNRRNNFADV